MTGGEDSDHVKFMLALAASHENCAKKENLLQLRDIAMAGVRPLIPVYITYFVNPVLDRLATLHTSHSLPSGAAAEHICYTDSRHVDLHPCQRLNLLWQFYMSIGEI